MRPLTPTTLATVTPSDHGGDIPSPPVGPEFFRPELSDDVILYTSDVDGDETTEIHNRSPQMTPIVARSTQFGHQDRALDHSPATPVGGDTTPYRRGILTTLPPVPGSNEGGEFPTTPVTLQPFPLKPSVLPLDPSADHLARFKATRPPSASPPQLLRAKDKDVGEHPQGFWTGQQALPA
ncbi:uncharacterized protein LOC144135282 [Amblyomma americanum]